MGGSEGGIDISTTEIIKNPNPIEENREIPNIDAFNNPNSNLHVRSQFRVPTSLISFSQGQKGQIPASNSPLLYPPYTLAVA